MSLKKYTEMAIAFASSAPSESPQGPEQGLVAATAEQAKRQGAAEGLRESGRVAPGEALEAISQRVDMWRTEAAILQAKARNATRYNRPGKAAELATTAAALFECARELARLLPEPDSGADAGE